MVAPRDVSYRAAGFAGELGLGRRPALIVVDLMMAYFDRSSPMYAAVENVADSVIRLVDAAYQKEVPVFLTQQFYEEATANAIYARKVPALQLLRPGSPLAALLPTLPIDRGTVIVKSYPSAFHGTDLADRLAALGVDTLVITGLTTSGCIRATAMDALLNGLIGVVVREAVGDRDQAQHRANLFDINAKLGDVRGEEEVLAWLDHQLPAPERGSCSTGT
jgi:nicotinamidase-related amidase